MTRNNIIRWVLDLVVVVVFAYAGWSVNQFTKLTESDIKQQAQIDTLLSGMEKLAVSLDGLSKNIANMARQQEALVTVVSFRPDPWTGSMMHSWQNEMFDALTKSDIDLKIGDLPNVHSIQTEYSHEIIPEGFLEP